MVVKKIANILSHFCQNTSLVGLGYISNKKIHLTERLFWLICIILSSGGSYYLIREYQNTFESKAISLVLEGTRPQDKSELPAIAICEEYEQKIIYEKLVIHIEELGKKKGITDNYSVDVEDFLLHLIFIDTYSFGSLGFYCSQYFGCSDCIECPLSGYAEVADFVRANCSELITDCKWNGKSFNCCHYFLPIQSETGRCFVLNSMQTTTRNSPHWLKTEIGWDAGNGKLELVFAKNTHAYIMNPEDMPFAPTDADHIKIIDGQQVDVQLRIINMFNDQGVRDVSPEHRRCRFPDENFGDFGYEFYSFSACVFNCFREIQLQACGCVIFHYIVKSDDKTPTCDYDGYLCLDQLDLVRPRASLLHQWRTSPIGCTCLPSCTEHEIDVFQTYNKIIKDYKKLTNQTMGRLKIIQSKATQQFRRQAVRTRLDGVVTIGGILGLFMGASILSGIEILYFFFVRIFHLNN